MRTVLIIILLLMSFPAQALFALEPTDTAIVLRVGRRAVTAAEFERYYAGSASSCTPDMSREEYTGILADYLRKVQAAEDAGLDTIASFRNEVGRWAASLSVEPDCDSCRRQAETAVRDFRDGLLVYEITELTVNLPARTDTAALRKYFIEHKSDFSWDAPRFKGHLLAAVTDSLAGLAAGWIAANHIHPDSATSKLRRKFGPGVKVQKILAHRSVSPVLDALVFGGSGSHTTDLWKAFRLIDGRLIGSPEEYEDVKGQVVEALRLQLEKQWLEKLRKQYK